MLPSHVSLTLRRDGDVLQPARRTPVASVFPTTAACSLDHLLCLHASVALGWRGRKNVDWLSPLFSLGALKCKV